MYIEMPDLREAVTGYALRCDQITLIYDFTKIVKLVMKQHRVFRSEFGWLVFQAEDKTQRCK